MAEPFALSTASQTANSCGANQDPVPKKDHPPQKQVGTWGLAWGFKAIAPLEAKAVAPLEASTTTGRPRRGGQRAR